jgi:hypothetical protein
MKCPHCEKDLTVQEIKTIWASYTGRLAAPHAGPGRPRWKKRCRCGEMTLGRAKQRNHVCPVPVKPRVKKTKETETK